MAVSGRFGRRAALSLPAAALALPAHAQAWRPGRPVRLVLPFAAGGITDILARALAEPLSARLGQPVVVENRPGGGGNIAGEAVANAPADGTTLLVASQGMTTMNSVLFRTLSYDPDNAFVPLVALAKQANFVSANPAAPGAGTLAGVLEAARRNPGSVTFGSPGVGSFAHMSMELLRFMAGVQLTHVPYRGSSLMLTDLIAGQITLGMDAAATSGPHIRNGAIRVLATSGPARLKAWPDVPTVAETPGWPLAGYDADAWYAVYARATTPEAIMAALDAEIRAVTASAAFLALLENRAADPMPDTRPQLLRLLRQEQTKWQDVVRRSGARAE